jgi:hypothetical protein
MARFMSQKRFPAMHFVAQDVAPGFSWPLQGENLSYNSLKMLVRRAGIEPATKPL